MFRGIYPIYSREENNNRVKVSIQSADGTKYLLLTELCVIVMKVCNRPADTKPSAYKTPSSQWEKQWMKGKYSCLE